MSIFGLFLASCVSIQEKPPQVDKNTPEYIYEKAVISMKYNLVDEAIKYLTQALSLDSTHYPSCYLLGVAYYKRGNLVEARATLEKCIQLKPDDPDAHAYLANVYQNLGLGEEAEKEFRKAYVIDESFHASYSLAQLYYEQDKLEPALEYIQKAVQKNNKSASAYNLQGVIQNKLGRYPEAILSFQNAIRNDSKHFVAGVNLGVAYINNKNYDKARELLTHLLSLVQDQPLKDKIMEYLKAIKQLPSPKSTDPAYLS
jgi:tetratricopeptide (TPR) repeat protein